MLALLARLTTDEPSCVPDLLSLSTQAVTGDPMQGWMGAAERALGVLACAASATVAAPASRTAAAVLHGLSHALTLLRALAAYRPTSVLRAVGLACGWQYNGNRTFNKVCGATLANIWFDTASLPYLAQPPLALPSPIQAEIFLPHSCPTAAAHDP